ncbi:hypothetical protein DPMN_155113 [Dreissena polymorpha]|uniref:Uncharacterized protein n=1 Tax=Dreissena polymorpha TaxID=45954 RepID=A0A9D4FNA7_DREPO|nr:hypothetical protein DPMN_155113 [Dreissena polymorpha]
MLSSAKLVLRKERRENKPFATAEIIKICVKRRELRPKRRIEESTRVADYGALAFAHLLLASWLAVRTLSEFQSGLTLNVVAVDVLGFLTPSSCVLTKTPPLLGSP